MLAATALALAVFLIPLETWFMGGALHPGTGADGSAETPDTAPDPSTRPAPSWSAPHAQPPDATAPGARQDPAEGPAAGECGLVSALLEPSCGAWFGIWPRTLADGTRTTDLVGNTRSLQERLGREFDLVSRYYGWNQLPFDAEDEAFRDSGKLLLIDLRARDFGTDEYTSWRSIAAGEHDVYLTTIAQRAKEFGAKVFFSFHQEPEYELERDLGNLGTPADYAAAYRQIWSVFDRSGVDNVIWVWWVMGYLGVAEWYPDLYPGDAYVDWISWDPYDFNECHGTGFRDPDPTVARFHDWLGDNRLGAGKPLMLSEYGSHGTDRGDWYRGFADAVKDRPRIKAVIQWNSMVDGCDLRVTQSRDNWDGFAELAADPYFNQPRPRL